MANSPRITGRSRVSSSLFVGLLTYFISPPSITLNFPAALTASTPRRHFESSLNLSPSPPSQFQLPALGLQPPFIFHPILDRLSLEKTPSLSTGRIQSPSLPSSALGSALLSTSSIQPGWLPVPFWSFSATGPSSWYGLPGSYSASNHSDPSYSSDFVSGDLPSGSYPNQPEDIMPHPYNPYSSSSDHFPDQTPTRSNPYPSTSHSSPHQIVPIVSSGSSVPLFCIDPELAICAVSGNDRDKTIDFLLTATDYFSPDPLQAQEEIDALLDSCPEIRLDYELSPGVYDSQLVFQLSSSPDSPCELIDRQAYQLSLNRD